MWAGEAPWVIPRRHDPSQVEIDSSHSAIPTSHTGRPRSLRDLGSRGR